MPRKQFNPFAVTAADISGLVAGAALTLYALVTRPEKLLAYQPERILTTPSPVMSEAEYYLWLMGCAGGFLTAAFVSAVLAYISPLTRFVATTAWTFFLLVLAIMLGASVYWTVAGAPR